MQESPVPSPITATIFLLKSNLLKMRRAVRNVRADLRRWPSDNRQTFPILLAESRTPLWSNTEVAERVLQQGKVQNLRCAVRHIQHIVIPAQGTFSFWKQIGRATSRRGYVEGRQIQEGCIVPAVGGGLCQLSNALYDLALQSGCTILERHPHTRIVPGSAAASGRDATVFWNYLDLQFRPEQPVLLAAQLTRDTLIVRIYGRQPAPSTVIPPAQKPSPPQDFTEAGRSCLSCGVEACFRHRAPTIALHTGKQSGRTAYLLEEWSPEFACWLRTVHTPSDSLGIPLDGQKWHLARYAWETSGYADLHTATWETLRRSLTARRLAQQGAARQQAQIYSAERLAQTLAKSLSPDCEQLCVAQNLLPYLWQAGHLGGRRFTVLLTRQPIALLQANLDSAAALHPESLTLRDFRAPQWLGEAETEALQAAERLFTPHSYLASLFPHRTTLLPWSLPEAGRIDSRASIVFPGPTVARKGAIELREAIRRLDLEIAVSGRDLEGAGFWDGVRVKRLRPEEDCLRNARLVVQPAFVEDRPRLLLRAIASNIPVIATDRCGLKSGPSVQIIPCGDVEALTNALQDNLR